MPGYRTVIHGQVIEARTGDFASQQVLLNGRPISRRAWYSLGPSSHHFDFVDDRGVPRHAEVCVRDSSKLGLGRYRMVVLIDGIERASVEPLDPAKPPCLCLSCGYELRGLPAENAEVRCPECGRHTPAAMVDPAR